MSVDDEDVIWATSTTGDDFQCVHIDDWREAKKRIADLEAALRHLVDAVKAGEAVSGAEAMGQAEAVLQQQKQ